MQKVKRFTRWSREDLRSIAIDAGGRGQKTPKTAEKPPIPGGCPEASGVETRRKQPFPEARRPRTPQSNAGRKNLKKKSCLLYLQRQHTARIIFFLIWVYRGGESLRGLRVSGNGRNPPFPRPETPGHPPDGGNPPFWFWRAFWSRRSGLSGRKIEHVAFLPTLEPVLRGVGGIPLAPEHNPTLCFHHVVDPLAKALP